MTAQAIQVSDLRVSYGEIEALVGGNLSLPCGSCCAIVGPNGAGKSTLIKAILGLEKSQGQIYLFGQDKLLDKLIQSSVAYIPQTTEVNWRFPVTVFDIVMMGRFAKIKGWFKKPSRTDIEIVEYAIETLALQDLKERQIDQLSGGQRQRVFIARAIAQEADLYLMDEPLAGVDIQTEEIIMQTLKDFQTKGKTSLVIHHELSSLRTYFDYLVWVNKTIIASGPINDVLTIENYQKTYHTNQAKELWMRGVQNGFNG